MRLVPCGCIQMGSSIVRLRWSVLSRMLWGSRKFYLIVMVVVRLMLISVGFKEPEDPSV